MVSLLSTLQTFCETFFHIKTDKCLMLKKIVIFNHILEVENVTYGLFEDEE